jgi:hypothetical protein
MKISRSLQLLSLFGALLLFPAASAWAAGGETCGVATPVVLGASGFSDSGSTAAATGDYSTSFYPSAGRDHVWSFSPPSSGYYHLLAEANFDVVLYVTTNCSAVDTGFWGGMNGMGPVLEPRAEHLDLWFTSGTTYYLILDGAGAGEGGGYTFSMSKLPGESAAFPHRLPNLPLPACTVSETLQLQANDHQNQLSMACAGGAPPRHAGPDVAYAFTPTRSTVIRLEVTVSGGPLYFGVSDDGGAFFYDCKTWFTTPPMNPQIYDLAVGQGRNIVLLFDTEPAGGVSFSMKVTYPPNTNLFQCWNPEPFPATGLPFRFDGTTNTLWDQMQLASGCSVTTPAAGNDRFFSLAPISSRARITLHSDYDAVLWAFQLTGSMDCMSPKTSCVGVAEAVGGAGAEQLSLTGLSTSNDYIVAVDGDQPGDKGSFELLYEALPDNDTCATARTIPGNQSSWNDPSGFTTSGVDDISISCSPLAGTPGPDVVYSITPDAPTSPRSWTFRVTPEPTYDVALALVDSCGATISTCLAVAGGGGPGMAKSVTASLTNGNTYYLIVDSTSPTSAGTFTLDVDSWIPGDVCANAFAASGSASGSFDIGDFWNDVSRGGSLPAGDALLSASLPAGQWALVADPAFDLTLVVAEESPCDLATFESGGTVVNGSTGCARETARLDSDGITPFQILFDGASGAASGAIAWQLGSVPSNDTPMSGTPLADPPIEYEETAFSGTITFASSNPTPWIGCAPGPLVPPGPDVFYKINAMHNARYRFRVESTDFDVALVLLDGAGATCLAYSNAVAGPGREQLEMNLTLGGTYILAVDSPDCDASGSFTGILDRLAANDTCSGATANPATFTNRGESWGPLARIDRGNSDFSGSPEGCGGEAAHSTPGPDLVWYWAPDSDETGRPFRAEVVAPFDSVLFAVTDCSDVAGSCLAASTATAGSPNSIVYTPPLSSPPPVWFVLDSVDPAASGFFDFRLGPERPMGDNCARAIFIPAPESVPYLSPAPLDTRLFWNDFETSADCAVPVTEVVGEGRDVVFRVYVTRSGRYHAKVDVEETDPFDAILYLYENDAWGCFEMSGNNFTSCMNPFAGPDYADAPGTGDIDFLRILEAGRTYDFVVDGKDASAEGSFRFSLTLEGELEVASATTDSGRPSPPDPGNLLPGSSAWLDLSIVNRTASPKRVNEIRIQSLSTGVTVAQSTVQLSPSVVLGIGTDSSSFVLPTTSEANRLRFAIDQAIDCGTRADFLVEIACNVLLDAACTSGDNSVDFLTLPLGELAQASFVRPPFRISETAGITRFDAAWGSDRNLGVAFTVGDGLYFHLSDPFGNRAISAPATIVDPSLATPVKGVAMETGGFGPSTWHAVGAAGSGKVHYYMRDNGGVSQVTLSGQSMPENPGSVDSSRWKLVDIAIGEKWSGGVPVPVPMIVWATDSMGGGGGTVYRVMGMVCADLSCNSNVTKILAEGAEPIHAVSVDWSNGLFGVEWETAPAWSGTWGVTRHFNSCTVEGTASYSETVLRASPSRQLDPTQRGSMIWDGSTFAFAWAEGNQIWFARTNDMGSFETSSAVTPRAVWSVSSEKTPRLVDIAFLPSERLYRLSWVAETNRGVVQTLRLQPDGSLPAGELALDAGNVEYGHKRVRALSNGSSEVLVSNGGATGFDQKVAVSLIDRLTHHTWVNSSAGSERNVSDLVMSSSGMKLDAVRAGSQIALAFSGPDGGLRFWKVDGDGARVWCATPGESKPNKLASADGLVGPAIGRNGGSVCSDELVAVGARSVSSGFDENPLSWIYSEPEGGSSISGTVVDPARKIGPTWANGVDLAWSASRERFGLAWVWQHGASPGNDQHIAFEELSSAGAGLGPFVQISSNLDGAVPPGSPSVVWAENAAAGYGGRWAVAWIDRRDSLPWKNPSLGFAFWNPDTATLDFEAPIFPLENAGVFTREVRLAWNGVEYGLLFTDAREVSGQVMPVIRFARLDRSGTFVPGSDLVVDVGEARDLQLEWNGSLYAASWLDTGAWHSQVRMTEISRFGQVLATPFQISTGQATLASPRLVWMGDSYRAFWFADVGFKDVFMARLERPDVGLDCPVVNYRPFADPSPGGHVDGCDTLESLSVNLQVPRTSTSLSLDGSSSTSGSFFGACPSSEDGYADDPGGSVVRYAWKLNSDLEPSDFDHISSLPTWSVNWSTLVDNGMSLPGSYKVWLQVTDNTETLASTVPDSSAGGGPTGIRSIDVVVNDITPPTVSVATPNGGETFVVGTPRTISWSMSDDVDVDHSEIWLCTKGSSCTDEDWTLLATVPAPTTTWVWNVPSNQTLSATCRIRVVAYDTASPACVFPAASCNDRGFDDSNANFYVVASNPEGVRTLVLWHSGQFASIHGGLAASNTSTKLGELVANERVVGSIFDLANDTTIDGLYSAWNADRTSTTNANALAAAIRAKLFNATDGLVTKTYTGTKWIVLVGDDRLLPFHRVTDATGIMYEGKYGQAPLSEMDCTASEGAAICGNFYLSDSPYGDPSTDTVGGISFALPDYGVGRLAETPTEIATIVDTFIARAGQVTLSSAFVAGYDFLDDGAVAVRSRYQAKSGITTSSLIASTNPGFTASDLQTAILSGTPKTVVALLVHANHYTFGVPSPPSGGLDATTMDGLSAKLTGTAPYSIGCHSGLVATTTNPAYHPLDLPQVMARKGVPAYIGNTGFGWGLSIGIGLSERLVELYTQQLLAGGTVEVGSAWIEAKRRYFLEQSELDVFDKKILEEWTIYGLPMYRIAGPSSVATVPTPFAGDGTTRVDWNGVTIEKKLEKGGKGATTFATLPDGLTQLSLSFAFSTSSYAKVATSEGDYYTLNGEATGEIGLPIQPKFTYDSRLSGARLHGTLWLGGDYRPATLKADDGFESGSFGSAWTNGSPTPWTIGTTSPYRGTSSAKSGSIGHSATSDLDLSVSLAAGGRLSFARRISSEPGNDFLELWVDGVLKDAWSGELAWEEVSFSLGTGAHTVRFRWTKNGSGSVGSDAAWIDAVRVDDDPNFDPVMGVPQNSSTTPRGEPTPFIKASVPSATGYDPKSSDCAATSSRWDSLTVQTGFTEEPSIGVYKERLFDTYDLAGFYSNSCDFLPPAIADPGPSGFATVSGTTASFSVQVSDSGSGAYRTIVLYNDTLSVPKGWKPLELTYDSASTRWKGSLSFRAPTPYIVQAVDSAGNVAAFTETVTDKENGTGSSWGTSTTVPKTFTLTFADLDADGLADSWESQYGISDPAGDGDNDLLTNLEEFRAGTIPTNPDSDGGEDNDGSELRHGRDPLAPTDDETIEIVVSKINGGADVRVDWTGSTNASLDGPFWVYRSLGDPYVSSGEVLSSPSMPLGNGTRLLDDVGKGNDGNTWYYVVRNVPIQYPPPLVVAVTPATGPAAGGTTVTIHGDDFRAGARVRFGSSESGSVTVVNSSKIVCTSPLHAAGTVDVTVENSDSQAATKGNAFTYY